MIADRLGRCGFGWPRRAGVDPNLEYFDFCLGKRPTFWRHALVFVLGADALDEMAADSVSDFNGRPVFPAGNHGFERIQSQPALLLFRIVTFPAVLLQKRADLPFEVRGIARRQCRRCRHGVCKER